jgi:hypothetical protein
MDEDDPPYTYRVPDFWRAVAPLDREWSPRATAIRRLALGTSCPLCGRILDRLPSATGGDPVLRCSRKEHADRDPFGPFDVEHVRR